jgi:hypothetical protein
VSEKQKKKATFLFAALKQPKFRPSELLFQPRIIAPIFQQQCR